MKQATFCCKKKQISDKTDRKDVKNMTEIFVNFTNEFANLIVKYNTVANINTILDFAKSLISSLVLTGIGVG